MLPEPQTSRARVRPMDLRCEYLAAPQAIEEPLPRLSWKLRDPQPGAKERAYQIAVASRGELLATPDLWDSGRIAGPRGNVVRYSGRPLRSGENCHWRVRVWDRGNRPTAWSKPASWSMGLLKASDWKGRWICEPPGLRRPGEKAPCFYFRRTFQVKSPVRRASLYLAALGLAEPWLNGKRVTGDCLVPGWTDFRHRAQYVAYDVTALLASGRDNAIGVILGPGWYTGFWDRPKRKFR
jgi:alpha-L-rhamnosidase